MEARLPPMLLTESMLSTDAGRPGRRADWRRAGGGTGAFESGWSSRGLGEEVKGSVVFDMLLIDAGRRVGGGGGGFGVVVWDIAGSV